MSDFQRALFEAGLITQQQYDAGKRQDERKSAKERHKMIENADPLSSFTSLRSFMDHAKKELRKEPSATTVRRLIGQAHEVADRLKLPKKRRGKMHAFLAKVGEGLVSRLPEDRAAFLDEVFRTLDPKLVSDEE